MVKLGKRRWDFAAERVPAILDEVVALEWDWLRRLLARRGRADAIADALGDHIDETAATLTAGLSAEERRAFLSHLRDLPETNASNLAGTVAQLTDGLVKERGHDAEAAAELVEAFGLPIAIADLPTGEGALAARLAPALREHYEIMCRLACYLGGRVIALSNAQRKKSSPGA